MKIRKNLEAVFLAATVLALTATYATAKVPVIDASPAVAARVAPAAVKMQTVVVKAKRLTAAEKAALA